MSSQPPGERSVGTLLDTERVNAAIAWGLIAVLTLVALQTAVAGIPLWGVLTAVLIGIVLIPPINYRRATVMVPWEVLAVASIPILARSLAFQLAVGGFFGRLLTYVGTAGAALVIAVELDVFTPVEMPDWVAVCFVVVTTMAAAGVWAVLAWLSDLYFATTFILDPAFTPHEQEVAVMWSFVAATLGGVVAGGIFELYFRRRARARDRLPTTVREVVEGE